MMLGLVDALGGSSPADAHAARLAMCWVGAAADVHDARLGRRVGLGQPRLMLMMLEFGCAEAGRSRCLSLCTVPLTMLMMLDLVCALGSNSRG